MFSLQLTVTLKATVNKPQKPVKLLKKEQFVVFYYRLLPVVGVTIYTQVTLFSNGFFS